MGNRSKLNHSFPEYSFQIRKRNMLLFNKPIYSVESAVNYDDLMGRILRTQITIQCIQLILDWLQLGNERSSDIRLLLFLMHKVSTNKS